MARKRRDLSKPDPKKVPGMPRAPTTPLRTAMALDLVRETIEHCRERNILPLKVIADHLFFYHSKAERLLIEVADRLDDKARVDRETVAMMHEMWGYRERAIACAEKLAPYVHPRLASVTLSADPEHPPPPPIQDNRTLVLVSSDDAMKAYLRLVGGS